MIFIINVKRLNKVVNSIDIINNINLNIKSGELIGLLGNSGCGKSTLMKILVGLDNDYTGSIYFRNKLVNNISIYDRDVRFLDNNTCLFENLSIIENIRMGFRKELDLKIQDSKIMDMLELLNLSHKININVLYLSHGQKQKIKFARLIIDNPDIVFLDEPFDGLDESNSEIIYNLIVNINKKHNTTFVISSHDTYEILEITERILIMDNGSILLDKSKNDMLLNHNLVSWNYFNIGTSVNCRIRKIYKFYCSILFFDSLLIIPKSIIINSDNINEKNFIKLFIDPRSIVYDTMINTFSININCIIANLVSYVDFIFYYQNIFKYNSFIMQINTIEKLTIGKNYIIQLKFLFAIVNDECSILL